VLAIVILIIHVASVVLVQYFFVFNPTSIIVSELKLNMGFGGRLAQNIPII